MTAGAYGAVQAGTYNTRPLVPEVLVNGAEWALVRPRVEVDAADRARPPAGLAVGRRASFAINPTESVAHLISRAAAGCAEQRAWSGKYRAC